MAAFFVDLDGTFFHYGTNVPLKGAVEVLREWLYAGHQVIFTTARCFVSDVRVKLDAIGFENCMIIAGVQSPRVIVNDQGAVAVNRKTDASWSTRDELLFLPIMDLQDEAFVG